MSEFLEVNKIMKDGNHTIKERMQMIDELKDEFLTRCGQAKELLQQGYKWCPKCKDYYKERAWEHGSFDEVRSFCVFADPINSSGDVYERRNCTVIYEECPKGHRVEKEIIEGSKV